MGFACIPDEEIKKAETSPRSRDCVH